MPRGSDVISGVAVVVGVGGISLISRRSCCEPSPIEIHRNAIRLCMRHRRCRYLWLLRLWDLATLVGRRRRLSFRESDAAAAGIELNI